MHTIAECKDKERVTQRNVSPYQAPPYSPPDKVSLTSIFVATIVAIRGEEKCKRRIMRFMGMIPKCNSDVAESQIPRPTQNINFNIQHPIHLPSVHLPNRPYNNQLIYHHIMDEYHPHKATTTEIALEQLQNETMSITHHHDEPI